MPGRWGEMTKVAATPRYAAGLQILRQVPWCFSREHGRNSIDKITSGTTETVQKLVQPSQNWHDFSDISECHRLSLVQRPALHEDLGSKYDGSSRAKHTHTQTRKEMEILASNTGTGNADYV